MKLLVLLFFFLQIYPITFAQNVSSNPNFQGIWVQANTKEPISSEFQAQWIWMDEQIESDMMLSRRTFQLDELPQKALLRITASFQYQLYVNGQYISRGPARSAPHHQSFDIWDITNLLHEGKNLLAVKVHHQKGKYSYHHDGRAGLLAQLDMSLKDETASIITDVNWKVSPDPSWNNEAPKINRFQLVVGDMVDLRHQINDWNTLDFDDTIWSNASVLMRKVGWPSPQKNDRAIALTPPWTSFVPRDVPYLLETDIKAVNLIQAVQLKNKLEEQAIGKNNWPVKPIPIDKQIDKRISNSFQAYQKANQAVEIPALGKESIWFLLFDFGKVINGMPKLEIEGTSGTKVEILGAPFVVNNQFSPKVVDSDFRDQLVLSGKKDVWEATYFKPTRYMAIAIYGQTEAIKLYTAGIHQIAYPFEQKGFMRSADAPWVEQYMEASVKTIDVCTTDGYTDNYRERRQYAQTSYYAALGNYWTFADHSLQRRYLLQVAQEQEANGIMPAYAPLAKDDYMIIMDSNCLWIRSLRNYMLYSSDTKTAKELLPAAIKLMTLLHSYTNSLGMIENPPYPYWLDHARIDRRGANFCLNGHYLGALEDFAQVLEWLGEAGSALFQQRANLLRSSLRSHLWDEQEALFADALIDTKRSDQFSEHANAMALSMKIATPSQAKRIAEKLLEKDTLNYIHRASGMTMVTPAMSYFLHKGLCEYGFVEESLQLFRKRFDKMLALNTNGTLWEEWWLDRTGRSGKLQAKSRSDAQTESAFPPALFGEYLLGVTPTKVGLKEVVITLPKSGVNQIEGSLPSPLGNLVVKWNLKENDTSELVLDIPRDMQVKLELEKLHLHSNKPIFVNGSQLEEELRNKAYLVLTTGKYQIRF